MMNKTIWQSKTRPQSDSKSRKVKEDVLNRAMTLLKGREMVREAFESGIFSKLKQSERSEQSSSDDKLDNDLSTSSNASHTNFSSIVEKKRTGLKILTPKQMLQRLPIALAQVKAGNNSENLLNEIRQIVYSLYQSKEVTKKYTITIK